MRPPQDLINGLNDSHWQRQEEAAAALSAWCDAHGVSEGFFALDGFDGRGCLQGSIAGTRVAANVLLPLVARHGVLPPSVRMHVACTWGQTQIFAAARGVEGLEALRLATWQKTPPDELYEIVGLKRLVLSGTQLKRVSSAVGQLRSLEVLWLQDNGDLQQLPKELGGLTQLRELRLSGCHRLETLPAELANCTRLEVVDLRGTGIRTVPALLRELPAMRAVYLSDPSATWGRPEVLVSTPDSANDLEGLQMRLARGGTYSVHLRLESRGMYDAIVVPLQEAFPEVDITHEFTMMAYR